MDDTRKSSDEAAKDGDEGTSNKQSWLHTAVRRKNKPELEKLLMRMGATEMEVVDDDGLTPLHLAAQEGRLSIAECLIEHGANVHAKVKRPDGEAKLEGATCLHIAALGGHEKVVKLLLQKGADSDILEHCRGDTALHAAALTEKSSRTISALLKVALEKDSQDTKKIVDAPGKKQRTPLHYAAGLGDEKKIKALLEAGANPSARDALGATPLHYAAGEIIEELLKAGANPSESDDLGATPLHYAARRRDMQGVEILINKIKGSEVMLKDKNGKTAMDWAMDVDVWILIKKACKKNGDKTQRTDLHWATIMGNLEVVKQLCKKHKTSRELLKANAEDKYGKTALQYAKEKHYEDFDGKTALQLYAKEKHYEDIDGKTALQYAKEKPYQDIETELLAVKEVERYESRLYRDRQVYVDAANAVLVGAALIASVTFAGWLQPPLSYTAYYNLPSLPSPASLPDQFQSYAGLQQHMGLRAFWVFNSLSFSFAVATVIACLLGVIPSRNVFIGTTVLFLRKILLVAVIFLAFSIVCVLAAFAAAGFTVLPPIFKYQANMMSTVIVGGTPCIVLLAWLVYRLWLAARSDQLNQVHHNPEDEQQEDNFLDMINKKRHDHSGKKKRDMINDCRRHDECKESSS